MTEHRIVINGQEVKFKPGQTILDVAKANNISIPTLCHLKGTKSIGACRICIVEVKGARELTPSCVTPAKDGMVVNTESEKVVKTRKVILELLLISGNHNCVASNLSSDELVNPQEQIPDEDGEQEICPAWGDCRLQDLAFEYRVNTERYSRSDYSLYPMELSNPLIVRDFSRCIKCWRCVQACNEVQVNHAINYGYRAYETKVVTAGDKPLVDSNCVFCGECVQVCPVGALVEKKSRYVWRPWKSEKIRSTCPYCGVGCQQWLHVQNGEIVKVTGVEDAEPNKGRLCVKGRFGYNFIYSKDRLKTPLIKENGNFREASWDEALDLVVDRFTSIIKEYGSDAIAGVSCARSINEDSYQMQKLFRSVIGTNNIDHCART